jgi:hypothetical protein
MRDVEDDYFANTILTPYYVSVKFVLNRGQPRGGGGGCQAAAPTKPQNQNFKNTDFVDMIPKFYVIYLQLMISTSEL